MDLNRFILAQEIEIEQVKAELKRGKKTTHWIWYMFPQLAELGFSEMSHYYGLHNLKEAQEYYANDYLRNNLLDLTELVLSCNTTNLLPVFGDIDTQKVRSSMTLFYLATKNNKFKQVIDKFYNSCLDNQTLVLLNMR